LLRQYQVGNPCTRQAGINSGQLVHHYNDCPLILVNSLICSFVLFLLYTLCYALFRDIAHLLSTIHDSRLRFKFLIVALTRPRIVALHAHSPTMAIFVDLGDEDNEPQQDGQPPLWNGLVDANAVKPAPVTAATSSLPGNAGIGHIGHAVGNQREEAHGLAVGEDLNQNSMTQALGCYP
jgi:hypothetical protein